MGRTALTDEQRKQIVALHGQGLTRNEIARKAGVSASSVSKVCGQAGLSFDRSRTEVATKARVVDLKAQRAALSAAYLADAQRLRAAMWTTAKEAQAVGGPSPEVLRWERDEPGPSDKNHLMRASQAAFTLHMKAVDFDAADGLDSAKALLSDLVEAFGVRIGGRSDDGS